jgi:hypothetical protein
MDTVRLRTRRMNQPRSLRPARMYFSIAPRPAPAAPLAPSTLARDAPSLVEGRGPLRPAPGGFSVP